MRVFLVPGFFGFTQLGTLNYFQRVSETLGAQLRDRGLDADIVEVESQPTSSIRRRALRLLETVREGGALEESSLHFVGHSTGGLDVRLLLTPGVKLEPSNAESQLGRRTRSVITLATPHFGTPIANTFTSLNGRNLLRVLTVLATSRPGRLGLYAAAQGLIHLSRLDDLFLQRDTLLDSLVERLLADLKPTRSDALFTFLREIGEDQGAMLQLTPESIDLFNASVVDRTGAEYVSFVTAAPPPRPQRLSLDPYQSATLLVFAMSWALASREHRHYPYPSPAQDVAGRIRAGLPFDLDAGTNDGVVPTLSQVWGRLGGVVVGDHLDVVGQFPHVGDDGKKYPGWLHSGSDFDDARFQGLWSEVADVIAEAETRHGG